MFFDENMTLDIQGVTMHFPDGSNIREIATGGVIRDGLRSDKYFLDEFDWDSTQRKMSRAFNCELEEATVSTNWSINEALFSQYFPFSEGIWTDGTEHSKPCDKGIAFEDVDLDEFDKILDT